MKNTKWTTLIVIAVIAAPWVLSQGPIGSVVRRAIVAGAVATSLYLFALQMGRSQPSVTKTAVLGSPGLMLAAMVLLVAAGVVDGIRRLHDLGASGALLSLAIALVLVYSGFIEGRRDAQSDLRLGRIGRGWFVTETGLWTFNVAAIAIGYVTILDGFQFRAPALLVCALNIAFVYLRGRGPPAPRSF